MKERIIAATFKKNTVTLENISDRVVRSRLNLLVIITDQEDFSDMNSFINIIASYDRDEFP